jgi:hypothetical protein
MCCAHEAPASGEKNLERIAALARDVSRDRGAQHLHRRVSRVRPKPSSSTCWTSWPRPASTAPAALPTPRCKARRPTPAGCPAATRCAKSAAPASWRWPRRCRPRSCASRVGATMQVLVDSAPGMGKKGGVGRSYADAPEIDGVCGCCRRRRSARPQGGRVHQGAHCGGRGARSGGGAGLKNAFTLGLENAGASAAQERTRTSTPRSAST